MNTKKEYIFETDKYFNSCHASTLLLLPDGDIFAAWFAGTREGADDVRIWYAKKHNGAWSEPKCLKTDIDEPHWNPVLHLKENETIRLFFKTGKKISDWTTFFCDSTDKGETWSQPSQAVSGDTSGGRGPVKNKCIKTSDGLIIAPASTEKYGRWRAFTDVSADDGDTWTKSSYIVRPRTQNGVAGTIQPTLWQDDDGVLHALLRSNKGFIYRSSSKNNGKSWSRAEKTAIPNNNSGIDCVKADDSNIYLLCNPVEGNWGSRSPLVLMKSTDNGKSFCVIETLEDRKDGEFSYPAIISSGNKLLFTYTYDRKNIVFGEIEL